MIPVKLDNPEQEFYLKRCIESIRTFYPTTLIVIVAASGTVLTIVSNEYTIVVRNPYFSTLGAMYLLHMNRYASHACILHDTMTLVKPLPTCLSPLLFLYHFKDCIEEYHTLYINGYKNILPLSDVNRLILTLKYGCFGCACIIERSIIERIGLLNIIPRIKVKYDFECMERILAYIAIKHRVIPSELSLCGDIIQSVANPWRHPEYSTFTNQDILSIGFPKIIFKSLCGRQ